jgi:hypothetical protein
MTVTKAIANLIFPHGNILDNNRSVGYHSWIVLALKLSLSGNAEQTFQLANLILLIVQAVLIFGFGYWATKNKLFSGTLTFLYLSSPIVFGLNRWVMTENFVMPALLAFGFLPAWLLGEDFRPSFRREIIASIAIAWIMGIFASLREYAIPSYLLPSLATALALAWTRRWDAFWSFGIVTSIFTLSLVQPWIQLFKAASFKFTQSEYFSPLGQWFYHVVIYVVGIALSLLFAIGAIFILRTAVSKFKTFWRVRKSRLTTLKDGIDPLYLLWITYILLIFFYAVMFVRSDNRLARAGIVFMFSILSFLLIGVRVLEVPNLIFKKGSVQFLCIILIVCSWCTSYYQLFVAFDGGKTFAFPAYDLEWYNHPYFLRPLNSPDDMHTYY